MIKILEVLHFIEIYQFNLNLSKIIHLQTHWNDIKNIFNLESFRSWGSLPLIQSLVWVTLTDVVAQSYLTKINVRIWL